VPRWRRADLVRRGDDADADPDHDEHGYNEDGGGVVELVHCVGF
jgi:hypothetical protein